MRLLFTPEAWEDYTFWQTNNKAILKRINALIKEIMRSPSEGIGKPEPLKFGLSGCWSRRINKEHRIVYRIHEQDIHILACRYHYE